LKDAYCDLERTEDPIEIKALEIYILAAEKTKRLYKLDYINQVK